MQADGSDCWWQCRVPFVDVQVPVLARTGPLAQQLYVPVFWVRTQCLPGAPSAILETEVLCALGVRRGADVHAALRCIRRQV